MTLAFSLTLLRPAWLLVLLAAPLFAWLALRAAKGRPRAGDWAALAARTILLAALALALSVPRAETKTDGRSVAYVLDVSESVPPSALQRAGDFIRESASMRGEKDDAAFVVFADGAAVEAPFARVSATRRMEAVVIDPANLSSKLPRGESDVDGALRIARAGFPPGGARRIVLVTDGNETRGDAAAAVRELIADHVDVQVVPVRYEREKEVLVEKVVAPPSAGTVNPVPVRVFIESTHDSVKAKVRFLVDDKEVVARDETLKRGSNVFEMGHRFETSGFHRIEAIVEPESDGDPANNRGEAAVIVQGRGRVLVATNVPKSPLAEALRANLDADVDVGGSDAIPSDPGGLVPYDAVVLENVPAFALSDVQRRILASSVRDLGVGLVCVGGPQTYGPGGYAGTDLEAVLPVSSEILQKRVLPAGALVVVLHTCEFAGGNAAARAITKAAIGALSANDEIGVLEYDPGNDGDRWVIELQKAADKEALTKALDVSQPSDMPSLDSITRMAWTGLQKSTAAVKHMIIISDGDPAMPTAKLADQISEDRISISTVLVNPHDRRSAEAAMAHLAETHGGRYYFVDGAAYDRLPQIFMKEAVTVRRSAVSETPFKPSLRGLHRMLRDVNDADLPALRGYVVTSLKDHAELILAGPEEDPVLATWRCGLGQSVAWTSDASAWAQDWAAWGGYGRFFGQVVKSSLRALSHPGARASTDVSGGTAHVVLDVLRPDGSFANGLEARASAVLPDGSSTTLRVEQTGPGRYEGRFPAKTVGTSIATITYHDPSVKDDADAQVMAAVCVSYSAEHLAQRSNERFFAVLETAGATTLDLDKLDDALAKDPKAPNARALPWQGAGGESTETVDLWPWIAAAAALLLVADVAVRRVRLPWDKVFKRRPRAPAAKPAPVLARGPAKAAPVGAFDPTTASPPATRSSSSVAAAPPPSAPSSRPAAAAEEDGSGGLLGAKKRAQKKQKWEENA
jgi:hypothetical protein